MILGKNDWSSFERGLEKEWLVTNGLGGFASGAVNGSNARRYHGLLFAAMKPPAERHLVLSKLDESITVDGEEHEIYSSKSGVYVQRGYHYLENFSADPLPTYHYRVKDIFIEKKICMVQGENTAVIIYKIRGGKKAAEMSITPLVNFRNYHHCAKKENMKFSAEMREKVLLVQPFDLSLRISIECCTGGKVSGGEETSFVEGQFRPDADNWFIDMEYPIERQRGLDCFEDHYIPGTYKFLIQPEAEQIIAFKASVEDKPCGKDPLEIMAEEEARLLHLSDGCPYEDEFAKRLFRAADSYIVRRDSTDSKTIIAGYPWFTDWGRDTMISLPGLTLTTRRFDIAKDILGTFSKYVKDGLVPNVFPDEGRNPAYNSVDASLWYFEAVWKYITSSGDYEYIKTNIYPVLKKIIQAYISGTSFGIFMDRDSLISAGGPKFQITWMDAMSGENVFTPRNGKAVEVNSLWYNALKIMENLAAKYDEDSAQYSELAEKVRDSFGKTFWNEQKQCLYDVVGASRPDDSVRPNQVIALSLTHTMLDREKEELVLETVWDKLYTAYGLRTLSPDSPNYKGIYSEGPYRRDEAYHQGTAWPWLVGHFITAHLKVNEYSDKSRDTALKLLEPFRSHLDDACIGQISEIFDGSDPMFPKGCYAQAWSVAEVLRAYDEIMQCRVKRKEGSTVQKEIKIPENPTVYEATLIKAWRQDGYSDEKIANLMYYFA